MHRVVAVDASLSQVDVNQKPMTERIIQLPVGEADKANVIHRSGPLQPISPIVGDMYGPIRRDIGNRAEKVERLGTEIDLLLDRVEQSVGQANAKKFELLSS